MTIEEWVVFISFTIAINIVVQVLAWKIGYWLGNRNPKCPNNHNCGDCIHADAHWEDFKFRGFSCRIKAK